MSPNPQLDIALTIDQAGFATLTIPLLRGSMPMARMLERRLGAIREFSKLCVSPFSGKVRFKSTPPLAVSGVLERLHEALPGVDLDLRVPQPVLTQDELEDIEHLSAGSRFLYLVARGASKRLHQASLGQLDAKFLVPVGFIGFAAYHFIFNRAVATPWWSATGFFAYSLFRDLNRPR